MHANFQPHLAFHLGGMRPSPLLELCRPNLTCGPHFWLVIATSRSCVTIFQSFWVHGREDESAVEIPDIGLIRRGAPTCGSD